MTLAIEFKSIAKRLQPDNDSLQDLDDAINDKDQIYDVMSGKSDFVCGMATVILSIMGLNLASAVTEFALFSNFGMGKDEIKDLAKFMRLGNVGLVFMNKNELIQGARLGIIEGDKLSFDLENLNAAGRIIVWWNNDHQFDSGQNVKGAYELMRISNKRLIYFCELKKN